MFSVANRGTDVAMVGEVQVWETKRGEGRLLLRVSQQAKGIYSIALSPSGTRLATAHGDGTVRIWSVKQPLGKHGER